MRKMELPKTRALLWLWSVLLNGKGHLHIQRVWKSHFTDSPDFQVPCYELFTIETQHVRDDTLVGVINKAYLHRHEIRERDRVREAWYDQLREQGIDI